MKPNICGFQQAFQMIWAKQNFGQERRLYILAASLQLIPEVHILSPWARVRNTEVNICASLKSNICRKEIIAVT